MTPPPTVTEFSSVRLPADKHQRTVNVVVVSSVALAFISFWRAAAIVLCDLASTAYYIGGISEQAVGKAAPWFILGVMLFSYAVRAVYVESCTMFTRGGVYRVVKQAMGGSLAKLSVSALMFDYILTGPISAVAAGQYIVGLFGQILQLITKNAAHPNGYVFNATTHPQAINSLCVVIAIGVTIYFWRANIKGMHESSDKALRIMQFTTVMAVIIIGWSFVTLWLHPQTLTMPPLHPVFTSDSAGGREGSMGWLEHFPKLIGAIGLMVAFGHSLLAMSGEESLAQVNREIEAPKLKNLLRAGFVIFLYSLLLTSLVSFLAVLIIPDGKRVSTEIVFNGHEAKTEGVDYVKVDYLRKDPETGKTFGYKMTDDSAEVPVVSTEKVFVGADQHVERDDGGYRDNLINGLCHYLAGPNWIKVLMAAVVVIVGFMILAGAVNTSIVGSNGVLNRLAEDGVLTPWFLHPQKQFGTTHRLINMVVVLQIVTIVASWGDVNTLGEAYAFGVVWSFVFKTLAMVVLRFKDRSPRQYEVPMNFRIKRPGFVPALAGVPVAELNGSTDSLAHSAAAPFKIHNATPAANENDKVDTTIDLPIGIIIIFLVLLSTACINLMTKKTATIWGAGFTVMFLAAFIILEQISHHRLKGQHHEHLEQFNESSTESIDAEAMSLPHPNPVLVAVRNPGSLKILDRVLHETDTNEKDVVVVTCKLLAPMTQGITPEERTIQDIDRTVLTRVVTLAEEVGKPIFPLVIPTNNPLFAIAMAAHNLHATEVVLGESEKMSPDMLAEQFAMAWGMAIGDTNGEHPLSVRVVGPQQELRVEL